MIVSQKFNYYATIENYIKKATWLLCPKEIQLWRLKTKIPVSEEDEVQVEVEQRCRE